MAQHVRIVNEGKRPYTENFNGNIITIPVGGSIEMQRREAIRFMAQMSPPGYIDENGTVDNSKPAEKRLRMIPKDGKVETEKKFVCNLDGTEFDTQKELDEYLERVSDKVATMDDNGNITTAKRKAVA